MKKGISKNRHCSKRTFRWNSQRAYKGCSHVDNRRSHLNETNLQLTQKNFKWSRVATIIQIIDFLIDKLPKLINYMMSLLGMG